MKNKNHCLKDISPKSVTYMYYLASILILFGVAVGGVVNNNVIIDTAYLFGGILYFVTYLIKPKAKQNIRMKRLDNMNAFAGILFIMSAIFKMGYFASLGSNLWILFLSLAVVFMIYALVIMIFTDKSKKNNTTK